MSWSRVAAVAGLLLCALASYVAIEAPLSAQVAGRTYPCAAVVDPASLVSGQPVAGRRAREARTPAERRLADRVAAACSPLEAAARWAVWGGGGVGALLLLAGWTGVRDGEARAATRGQEPVPA